MRPGGSAQADPVSEAARARYVAIITDGNGRWAQRRGVSVEDGHRAGADNVKARHLVERMVWAESFTADNDRITLFVAFNYGGRAEIVDAARTFTGTTAEEFRAHLYAPEMHDPDLIIRTSGEQRLSNYLLWQSAYSELVFRDELWPDFTREAFAESLAEFEARRRRFGGR